MDHARNLIEHPLIAILRGVRPDEVEAVTEALIETGFRIVEIPLNSPDPFDSIERIVRRFGEDATIGAGTVLSTDNVARLRDCGGRLVVSPNSDPHVIRATVAAGMLSLPGYFTPSEAFSAIAAGAHGLKLFPADAANPALLEAHLAVLPEDVPVFAVGGIAAATIGVWQAAGARGFGLGSSVYAAGRPPAEVRRRAVEIVSAWNALARPEEFDRR